jgi:hypothetical protein
MGGPPMGGMPPGMQRPMRRGTSKAVPIVVSAGLAVGVFCGLLFGVGKKSEAVAAAPSSGTDVKPAAEPAKPDPVPPPAAGSAVVAAGSAAPAAGSAAPAAPAAPPVVEDKKIKLTVTLKPDAAMKDAKLYIDGKQVEGLTTELPADKIAVKVEVKSSGFRSVEKKIDLKGGDTAIEFEMAKRSSGGGTTPSVRPPKRPDKPPSSGGGGLIDI